MEQPHATAGSPHGTPAHPLISDARAINSLICLAVAACINLVALAVLFPRTFPGLAARLISPEWGYRRPNLRVRLLSLNALFLLIDDINQFAFIYSVWQTGHAAFLASKLILILFYLPSGPIILAAFALRTSVILVEDPTWRRRYLAAMFTFSTSFTGFFWYLGFSTLARILERNDPNFWFNSLIVPPWSIPFLFIQPAALLVASVTTLRVAFGNTQVFDFFPSHRARRHALSPTHPSPSGQPRARGVQVPLTVTFKLLTVALILLWCLHLIQLAAPPLPWLDVRAGAASAVSSALGTLVEVSFEWVFRTAQARVTAARRRKSSNAIASPIPHYSHLEQDGKESGDVEGVDGQDDAAPASKRSRTSDSSSRRLSDSEFLMGIKEVFQSVATADSKPVLTAALEWVQDAYNDNEEYQIDVATRLTEDQALRVMAVSESKRKRILEIFIQ
ncbi:hypothetical protein H9P43_006731 [Blastocladiella emersonii ATCC 22665]|nr:hypothetical protein H9P43_006731 [Blastocladiella emersonii ATCC 22665]